MHISAKRIDFLSPQKRRAAKEELLLVFLCIHRYNKMNMMEAVCQNGSSSMLSNLNIKGGARVGDMELFGGMFLYLAAKPSCV